MGYAAPVLWMDIEEASAKVRALPPAALPASLADMIASGRQR